MNEDIQYSTQSIKW